MMQLVRAVSLRQILARFPRDHSAINGHVRQTYDVKLEPQKQSMRQLKQSRMFAALPPHFNFFFSCVSSEEKIVFCTKPHIQSFRNCWEARNRQETKPLLEFYYFFGSDRFRDLFLSEIRRSRATSVSAATHIQFLRCPNEHFRRFIKKTRPQRVWRKNKNKWHW